MVLRVGRLRDIFQWLVARSSVSKKIKSIKGYQSDEMIAFGRDDRLWWIALVVVWVVRSVPISFKRPSTTRFARDAVNVPDVSGG
jgi:hypothetical protein